MPQQTRASPILINIAPTAQRENRYCIFGDFDESTLDGQTNRAWGGRTDDLLMNIPDQRDPRTRLAYASHTSPLSIFLLLPLLPPLLLLLWNIL